MIKTAKIALAASLLASCTTPESLKVQETAPVHAYFSDEPTVEPIPTTEPVAIPPQALPPEELVPQTPEQSLFSDDVSQHSIITPPGYVPNFTFTPSEKSDDSGLYELWACVGFDERGALLLDRNPELEDQINIYTVALRTPSNDSREQEIIGASIRKIGNWKYEVVSSDGKAEVIDIREHPYEQTIEGDFVKGLLMIKETLSGEDGRPVVTFIIRCILTV